MLTKIETLLKEQGPMTASVLARQIKSTEQAVDGMLELLVARGKVRKSSTPACGGHCCSAGSETELYRWTGDSALPVMRVD